MSSYDNRFSNRFFGGTAVALLGVALEMIGRGTYQAPTSLTSPTSPTPAVRLGRFR